MNDLQIERAAPREPLLSSRETVQPETTTHGAVSSSLAADLQRTSKPTASPANGSDAVIQFHVPTRADRMAMHGALRREEKNTPIDEAAGLQLIASAARLNGLSGKARSTALQALATQYFAVVGVQLPELFAQSQEAGKIKALHTRWSDGIGLTPSGIAMFMRIFGVDPLRVAIVNTILQLGALCVTPRISGHQMTPVLQRQQFKRIAAVGVPARFGAVGDIFTATVKLRNETIAMNRATDGNREERLTKLEDAKWEFQDVKNLHLGKYQPLAFENMANIMRTFLLAVGATIFVHEVSKHPEHAIWPIVFLFQLFGTAGRFVMSYNWSGPRQEKAFQLKTAEADMQRLPAEIGQRMVERRTGTKLPIGPQLAAEVERLGGLDEQAVKDLRALWKRPMANLMVMCDNLLKGEREDVIVSLAKALNIARKDISERQTLLDEGVVPQAPTGAPALPDKAAQKAREKAEKLYQLNQQVTTRTAALADGARTNVEHLQNELTSLFQDMNRLKQDDPDSWRQIRGDRQDKLLLALDRHEEEVSKMLADSIKKDFRGQAGHTIQKYAKGWAFFGFFGGGAILLFNAGAAIASATGHRLSPEVRYAVIWGWWGGAVACELAGGMLVADKNQNRLNWQKDFRYAPPGTMRQIGESIKGFLKGTVVLPREMGRLPYAAFAEWRADVALTTARRAVASTGTELGPVRGGENV